MYQPTKQHFYREMMQPINGSIALPTAPGLGLKFDQAAVNRFRVA